MMEIKNEFALGFDEIFYDEGMYEKDIFDLIDEIRRLSKMANNNKNKHLRLANIYGYIAALKAIVQIKELTQSMKVYEQLLYAEV